jgi:hypothetical protein
MPIFPSHWAMLGGEGRAPLGAPTCGTVAVGAIGAAGAGAGAGACGACGSAVARALKKAKPKIPLIFADDLIHFTARLSKAKQM